MDELYDEFGNYIGPDLESDEDEEIYRAEMPGPGRDDDEDESEAMVEDVDNEEAISTAVVLHEDKKYYPTAMEIYGPGVEVSLF